MSHVFQGNLNIHGTIDKICNHSYIHGMRIRRSRHRQGCLRGRFIYIYIYARISTMLIDNVQLDNR